MTVSVTKALDAAVNSYLEKGANPQHPLVIEFSSRVARDEFVRMIASDIGMMSHELTHDRNGRREPPMYNRIEFTVRTM